MHTHSLTHWTHPHRFLGAQHSANERRTWVVVTLTAAMMIGEIAGGILFGSMALVADGWHMSTHAGALAVAALAYRYADRHRDDARFSFGTGKLGELAGYSSALTLAMIALLIGYESTTRLFNPVSIRFDEAIAVAALGLIVNLASAWLLREGQTHADGHRHQDHNLRAAYLHVVADAVTSVLAIVALVAGRLYGWVWMDPIMGIAGSLVIAHWSIRLLRSSSAALLDEVADPRLAATIEERLQVGSDRLTDLHVWRVGPGHTAVIAAIVSDRPESPEHYKSRLKDLGGLSHVTIEVHACPHAVAGG